MKNFLKTFIVLLFSIFMSFSFIACSNHDSTKVVPDNNIKYQSYFFGNVIDEGRQAVFLCFSSDYSIVKIEITGEMLNRTGNSIYDFEECMTFSSPTKSPRPVVLVDCSLINNIKSVRFTKIVAYTEDELNFN